LFVEKILNMRFAVLGDSPSVNALVQAIVANAGHELVATALAPQTALRLRGSIPRFVDCSGWEELLLLDRLDAVIVADAGEETLRAARQLAAVGKALLVAPAIGQAATFAYELTLLQADQPTCFVPLFGWRAHPLVGRLRSLVSSGAIGEIRHLQLERRIVPGNSPGDGGGLSSNDIAAAFLSDADLVQSIWGDYNQVTAIRSGDPVAGISLLTVTLGGPAAPQVLWSATVAETEPRWRLHVAGQRGTITLHGTGNGDEATLETAISGQAPEEQHASFDSAEWLLSAFAERTAAGATQKIKPAASGAASVLCPDWADFIRSVDLFDAIERSIRRRRTIDIHFETPSERGQFKTQMTAAGCSILLLTLGAFVAYLLAETVVNLGPRVKQILLVLTFLPLAAFLILQALLFVARPSTSTARRGQESPREESDRTPKSGT
jgi:myo-inositol 2-dehydrogenase/D-chiro-inositol 1-dehydrogenase